MKFLQRLLRGRDVAHVRKQEPLDEPSTQFCAWKGRVTIAVAEGLAGSTPDESRATADLIRSDFLPALEDDPDPATKARTERTLERLVRDLRPPKNDDEAADLDNAAFYYCKRLLVAQSRPTDVFNRHA
jgi:hypothetical protein